MLVNFRVLGKPVPQGSMTAVRAHGYVSVRHQAGEALAVYRQSLRIACAAQLAEGQEPLDYPMVMRVRFTYRRPTNHFGMTGGRRYVKPQYRDAYPTGADLDKLVRAVGDALTGTLYEDDRLIVRIEASKVYGDKESTHVECWTLDSQMGEQEDAPWVGEDTGARTGA